MERLTEKHYKASDGYYMKCSGHCCKEDFSCEDCNEFEKLVDRLGEIEDVLGQNYNLELLKEIVQAERDGRIIVMQYAEQEGVKRIKELVEADKEGRCVLLQVKPNLKQGAKESRCFILLDNGEICEDNVYNVSIGPDNSGNMNTIYSTFDFGDFESQEVGSRIFWDEESACEAALKGENHD